MQCTTCKGCGRIGILMSTRYQQQDMFEIMISRLSLLHVAFSCTVSYSCLEGLPFDSQVLYFSILISQQHEQSVCYLWVKISAGRGD